MANVCDYSTMTHYNPGEFNSKYKTQLDGNIVKVDKEVITSKEVLGSFKDDFYETFVTTNDLILYRVYGRFKRKTSEKIFGARLNGAFATTEFAESVYDVKMRMALNQLWGNPKMFEAKILVPSGTKINIGVVAPVTSKSGTVLSEVPIKYFYQRIGQLIGLLDIAEFLCVSFSKCRYLIKVYQKTRL